MRQPSGVSESWKPVTFRWAHRSGFSCFLLRTQSPCSGSPVTTPGRPHGQKLTRGRSDRLRLTGYQDCTCSWRRNSLSCRGAGAVPRGPVSGLKEADCLQQHWAWEDTEAVLTPPATGLKHRTQTCVPTSQACVCSPHPTPLSSPAVGVFTLLLQI